MTIKYLTMSDFGYNECIEDVNVLALKTDTDSDFTDSFNFSSQSLPSSCPSTTGSFSSTSSYYDPFTPTSRTSSPSQHIDYAGSFDDDSIMLNLTPPPSATSGYFPLDIKQTVAPVMLTQGIPSTPSRCDNIFDSTLSTQDSNGLDFTPNPDLSLYSFDGGLDTAPFLDPSSMPQFDSGMSNFDAASMWAQHGDSSPITFSSSPSMHLVTPHSSPFTSPYGHSRRRVAMDGPQMRSTMLQMQTMNSTAEIASMMEKDLESYDSQYMSTLGHMQQTPTKSRAPRPRSAAGRSGPRCQNSYRVNKDVHSVKQGKLKCKVQDTKKARFHCDFSDCSKTYRRAEHLKRHQEGSHALNPQYWICEFCPEGGKKFDRADNFRDHVERHDSKTPGSRTKFHPGARPLLEKLHSEMKCKTKKPRESDTGNGALGHLAMRKAKTEEGMKTGNFKLEDIKTEPLY